MAVTWRLNGTDLALSRLRRMLLEFANQVPDRLTFDDPAVPFGAEHTGTAAVDAVALVSGGSGYTSAPTVAFTGGGGSGAAATAQLTPTSVASLAITNRGSGYTSAPTVSLTGGGGTGAAAAAAIGRGIAAIALIYGGSGYTSAPSVVFSGMSSFTIMPVATAQVSGGQVVGITIVEPGDFVGGATVSFSGGGSFDPAIANISSIQTQLRGLSLTNPGSGYTAAPTVGFSGGGGTGAAATAVLTGTSVAGVTLSAGGSSYETAPTVEFSGGGGGSGAAAVASLGAGVEGVRFALGTEVVLTRQEGSGDPVAWYRGHIRSTPATAEPGGERVSYTAEGPWHWLERIPFLQNYKAPEDPDDEESALETYLRGRAILAQDDAGDKVQLGEFLNEVLDYAIAAAPGLFGRADFAAVTGLQITIPWDEVVDLSCAEVISRALQWLPDAICWWDYTAELPELQINRRSALTALTLPIAEPGTTLGNPFEQAVRAGFFLRERPDLQRTGVVLIYTRTHRSNAAAWETYEIDKYPSEAVPNSPDSLVRTIQLAGSVVQQQILQQKVEVDPLETYLENTTLVTSGTTFDALAAWWKKHAPELRDSKVTIKGFRRGERWKADGSALDENAPDNELLKGAVTDWMEDEQDIVTEEQLVQIDCAIEVQDADDSSKKERLQRRLSVLITATNATSRTYLKSEQVSYTPPEETPTGLAQAVYNAISPLQYEGELVLVEREASVPVLVGRTVHLTGGQEAWETMAALVQRARVDLDRGETTITLGPARHLALDDLVEIYRVNRNRQPVTSWWTRTSGKTGTQEARAGLSLWHPVRPGGTANDGRARVYTAAVTVAGTVPTAAEFETALEGVYTSSNRPRAGDVVNLTVSSTVKFRAVVTLTNPGSGGIFNVSFEVDSITYYAQIHQVGIY